MEDGPSAYTPFFRRFRNESAAELEETRQLYEWVKWKQDNCEESITTIGKRIYASYRWLPGEVDDAFLNAMLYILDDVPLCKPLPPPDFHRMNLEEFVNYRNLLYEKQYFFQNQAHMVELVEQGMTTLMEWLTQDLPSLEEPSPFAVPLWCAYPNLDHIINRINHIFSRDEYLSRGLFKATSEKLYAAILAHYRTEERVRPPERSGLNGEELIQAYLGGTPFERLLKTPVPLSLPLEKFFEHVHLLGGSGAGKTVTIERLILWLQTLDDPPTVVLVDPHSDLVRKLARADLGYDPLIIDPRDSVHHPLALNIFAPSARMEQYDAVTREQVTAGAIETFINLFQNLGIPLTGKQDVFFRACCRMLLALPEVEGRNATIRDMLDLMHDPEPYKDVIATLPELQREFFEKDFLTKTFEQTRDQIRYRLQAIISEPTMERMFCAPETKVDFFDALNEGGMILIDCAKDFLKAEGSANFGRLMLSLILKAIMERAAVPAQERKPVILFIDEAATFFSRDISSMLEEVRKYKTGVPWPTSHSANARPSSPPPFTATP